MNLNNNPNKDKVVNIILDEYKYVGIFHFICKFKYKKEFILNRR